MKQDEKTMTNVTIQTNSNIGRKVCNKWFLLFLLSFMFFLIKINTVSYASEQVDSIEARLKDLAKNGMDTKENRSINISELNLDYPYSADASIITNNDIMPLTNPQPDLRLFVANPETLKDGQPTTKSELIWVYNDSDADGDEIVARLVEGFPEGYATALHDNAGNEVGFITRFTNPGTYTVDYYVMDSAQEISGIRYSLTIVTVGDYTTQEGTLISQDDVGVFTVPIDFSSMSTAALAFIQSEETNLLFSITDSEGNQIGQRATSDAGARKWLLIDKPDGAEGICEYTVTVAVRNNDFHDGSSSYKIISGSKDDLEEMLSYIDGAVLLGKYSSADETYFFKTGYTPSSFESYYKLNAESETTVTLLSYYSEIHFDILDMESMEQVYSSLEDSDAHRTEYTAAYTNAEKQKIKLSLGHNYYLKVYSESEILPIFVDKNILLTQGKGIIGSGYQKFRADNTITAGSDSFSPSAFIEIGDEVPRTARVTRVEWLSSGGVNFSDISAFRVKAPTGLTTWQTSKSNWPAIEYPYVEYGSSNTELRGTWEYSFKAFRTSKTMIPAIGISYKYEWGD